MEKKQDPRVVLEQKYDPRLDKLYVSTVRCPYCGDKIKKLQTACSCCGLSKMQIAHASNMRAKEMATKGERGKIVKMRRRPCDVKFWPLVFRLGLGGIFGWHNFYVGRRLRGWLMFSFMIVFIVQTFVFPLGDIYNGFQDMHPWREAVQVGWGVPFPLDFFGIAALVMWVSDVFAILFGWFKYPVRLGEVSQVR